MSFNKRRVVVFTGNSNSGSACIQELFERYADNVTVRAVFRTQDKAEPFRQKYPNLEIVSGVDASRSDSMVKAFENMDAALIVTPASANGFHDDADLSVNMINSAVENGVKYIVYVGSFSCHYPDEVKIISSRFLPSEALLRKLGVEKGVQWTSLRGGAFMDNLLGYSKDSIKNQSAYYSANTPMPMIDTLYIGKSGAACLASDDPNVHNGKYYEMNGPEMLTPQDIVNSLSKVIGREIKWIELSQTAIDNMSLFYQELVKTALKKGSDFCPFTKDIENLVGSNGTLEEFLKRHVQHFI